MEVIHSPHWDCPDFLKILVVVVDQEEEVVKQVERAVISILEEKNIDQIVKLKVEIVSDIVTESGSEKTLPRQHKLVISKI